MQIASEAFPELTPEEQKNILLGSLEYGIRHADCPIVCFGRPARITVGMIDRAINPNDQLEQAGANYRGVLNDALGIHELWQSSIESDPVQGLVMADEALIAVIVSRVPRVVADAVHEQQRHRQLRVQ